MSLAIAQPGQVRWSIVLCQLALVYFLAIKLWFDIAVAPMGDEAYYWMWGQHLSWSYLDHPPLDGWLQGLVALLFGWSNLSVRLLTWLTTGATFWIFWLWSARLSPADRAGWFWPTAAIYFAMPVIYQMTTAAFHDHLLLAFCLASAYFFHGFAGRAESGQGGWRDLYVSAVLLGLAVLSKYNGALLGVGYLAWIVWRPRLRRLLLDWRLWGAALVALAMQAPVIYWNATEGFASLRFHMSERGIAWGHPDPVQLLRFVATMALSISPFLFGALFRLPFLRTAAGPERDAVGQSTATFLASTAFWAVLSLYILVYFHWNVVAYAALAPIALQLLGRRIAFLLHLGWGLLIITPAMLSYTLTPMSLFGLNDPGAPASYGWPELAAEVKKQQASHPGSFLAATRYTYASQLGFQLHDTAIAALNPMPSQIDYWWNAADHAGEDAIVIADRSIPIDDARSKFASLEKLEDIPVVALGKTIWTFEIWLGRDFGHGTQ